MNSETNGSVLFWTERKGSKASIIATDEAIIERKDHPKIVLVQKVDNNDNGETEEHNNGNVSESSFN